VLTARSSDGLSAVAAIAYTILRQAIVRIARLRGTPLVRGCATETGRNEREIAATLADATCRRFRLTLDDSRSPPITAAIAPPGKPPPNAASARERTRGPTERLAATDPACESGRKIDWVQGVGDSHAAGKDCRIPDDGADVDQSSRRVG
jgi:hypothetical protein